MPTVNRIETTNLDTIYGSPTIPWSRPRDLRGSTISCVNGGNVGNTRSTAAWLGRARDGLYGRDVATCAGGQIPNGRALEGPAGAASVFPGGGARSSRQNSLGMRGSTGAPPGCDRVW